MDYDFQDPATMTSEQKQREIAMIQAELARRKGGNIATPVETTYPETTGIIPKTGINIPLPKIFGGGFNFDIGKGAMAGLKALPGIMGHPVKDTSSDLNEFMVKERFKQAIGANPEKEKLEREKTEADIASTRASTMKTNAELGILPKEMEFKERHYNLEQQNIDLDKERIASDTTRTSWQKDKDLADLNMRQKSLDLDREKFEQEKSTFGKKPEDIERKNKGEEEARMIKDTAQEMLDAVKEVKKGAKYFGPYGNAPSLLTSVGGMIDYGPRKKWEQYTQKLISGKIIELISKMKAVSKTGATGFGQLSEKEGQILRDASIALSKDLIPDDAIEILNQMEEKLGKVVGGNQSQSPDDVAVNQNKTGGQMMIDAQGNKAMVYPDGSYEEMR